MLKNFSHADHATQIAVYLQQCRWPHDKRKSPSAFPFFVNHFWPPSGQIAQILPMSLWSKSETVTARCTFCLVGCTEEVILILEFSNVRTLKKAAFSFLQQYYPSDEVVSMHPDEMETF